MHDRMNEAYNKSIQQDTKLRSYQEILDANVENHRVSKRYLRDQIIFLGEEKNQDEAIELISVE